MVVDKGVGAVDGHGGRIRVSTHLGTSHIELSKRSLDCRRAGDGGDERGGGGTMGVGGEEAVAGSWGLFLRVSLSWKVR